MVLRVRTVFLITATLIAALALSVSLIVGMGIASATPSHKPAPVTKITFKLDSHDVTVGDHVTGTLVVKTRSGHEWVPVEGAVVSEQVDGTEVASLTTDATGSAVVDYATTTEGDHVMKMVFAGDDLHKKAQRAQGFSVAAAATV